MFNKMQMIVSFELVLLPDITDVVKYVAEL